MKAFYQSILVLALAFCLGQCSDKLLNPKDITDLLEQEGGAPGSSSSQSTNASQNTNSNNTQSLDTYGLSPYSTGTTTFGSTGTATATPVGR
ncbi:hypothetical protein [Leptospira ryugenii]|uniref:hypothetical protein n=1 Tax=Leptospira ryugenii TaxID=1917863 RepID=UPI00107FC690|nr:hypothetical protein [Leptospira ryugenii]